MLRRNEKGFTLIELIVVIVIIGILAAIAIPRFMGAQDRARIGACEADVHYMVEAMGLYEPDHASYKLLGGSSTDYTAFKDTLSVYMTLPDTTNFSDFSYTGSDTTFTITVKAKDSKTTTVTGTPTGVHH